MAEDDKSLMEILDDMDATDEDLIEVLVMRNSECDERAVKEAADRRVQIAGSLEKANEQASAEMERATAEMLQSVEGMAQRHALLFDVQEVLASRVESPADAADADADEDADDEAAAD